jgi:hypothetical protein
MSAREAITVDIIEQLKNMSDPAPGLVTREYFDFEKLAITQYPAILVFSQNEERTNISFTERQGTLNVQLRCFLRGNNIDQKRNNLIEQIEQELETQSNRDVTVDSAATHYVISRISNIEVIERQPPLAELLINLDIEYVYKRGNV